MVLAQNEQTATESHLTSSASTAGSNTAKTMRSIIRHRSDLKSRRDWKALADRVPDPVRVLNEVYEEGQRQHAEIEAKTQLKLRPLVSRTFAQSSGILYAAMRAAGREKEAQDVEQRALSLSSGRDTVKTTLAEYASKVGLARLHHIVWSFETSTGGICLGVILYLLLLAGFTDLIYQKTQLPWPKLRNGAVRWWACSVLAISIFLAVLLINESAIAMPFMWLSTPKNVYANVIIGFGIFAPMLILGIRYLSIQTITNANALLAKGDFSGCVSLCEKSFKTNPRVDLFLVLMAKGEIGRENYSLAIKRCNQALSMCGKGSASSAHAMLALSAAYLCLTDSDNALRAASAALEVQKSSPEANFYRVLALLLGYRIDEALEEASTIPDSPLSHLAKAHALAAQNRWSDSKAECELAMTKGDRLPIDNTILLLSQIKAETGNLEQAIGDTDTALTMNPDWTNARMLRARYSALAGSFDKAKSDLNVLEAKTSLTSFAKASCLGTRAILALKRGEPSEAHSLAMKAIGIFELPELFVFRGVALFRLNNFDEAIDAFDKAIRIDKYCAAAFYHRHEVYAALQKNDDADRDLQIANDFNFIPVL